MEYFELTYKNPKSNKIPYSGGMTYGELQSRIRAVKQNMIVRHGYNEQSATDVLAYVGEMFARGDG